MSEILNNQVDVVVAKGAPGKEINIPAPNVPIKDYDEVIIKHISFVNIVAKDVVFLLWCTYTNSYVASFTIDADYKTDQSYETVIKLNRSSPIFGFKLHFFGAGGIEMFTDDSFIGITLQFNKYKNL